MMTQERTITNDVWMHLFIGPAVLTVHGFFTQLHHSAFFFFYFGVVYSTGIGFDFFNVNVVTGVVVTTRRASGTQPYG
jgi:hypothetical protein